MSWPQRVAATLTECLGTEVTVEEGFGPPTAVLSPADWPAGVRCVRDQLGCTFFDWLSASDDLEHGFSVYCHLAAPLGPGVVEHVLLRTTVPRAEPRVSSVVDLFAGAGWHERETHEMFGIRFDGHPDLSPLLLPDGFEGHPLRKEFVLASRVAKPWPGAKEPGESDHDAAPSRRRTAPPGVPAVAAWGPREPGTPAPDPLAVAQPASTTPRPRRRRDQGADDG